jgi:hypothetical protein
LALGIQMSLKEAKKTQMKAPSPPMASSDDEADMDDGSHGTPIPNGEDEDDDMQALMAELFDDP